MSTAKTKKRLMYATFAFIFLFGGIEYAVILPTIWLYLRNTYDAPEYMLGLVLSAYSFAAFLASPILGRLIDKLRCTKQIFLVCCMFEVIGSFLYFVGISQWLCVASRFICGLGAASEAIALAEVSRYTSEQERTGIISNLIATRQCALLLGPALNLFLRLADFKLGPFEVNKYSAPGAFMVAMWVLLMVLILTLYTEPKIVYSLEQQEKNMSQTATEPGEHERNQYTRYSLSSGTGDLLASDDGTDTYYPPLSSEKSFDSARYGDFDTSGEFYESARTSLFRSGQGASSTLMSHAVDRDYPPSWEGHGYIKSTPCIISSSEFDESRYCTPPSDEYHDPEVSVGGQGQSLADPRDLRVKGLTPEAYYNDGFDESKGDQKSVEYDVRNPTANYFNSEENQQDEPNTARNTCVDLSSSVEILTKAEHLINSNQWSASEKRIQSSYLDRQTAELSAAAADLSGSLFFYEDHFRQVSDVGSYHGDDEKTALLGTNSRGQHGQHVPNEDDPYIERNLTAFDDPIIREGKLGFFCNEYIRDEIIALVCLLFCAMFSQVCVETMVLPLSLEYLDFGELENSLLYFVCGVEIIIIFIIMNRLSRCVSDRVLLIFGAVMIIASNAWLLYFLPRAPPHNRSYNLPFFSIAVVLDVLALPFLFVCSTSLFSKLTRKETQGLSQGLRRAVVGIGTIMGPLWGSSASTKPTLLVGVLVAVQTFSLVLCLLSFSRLKPLSSGNPQDYSNKTANNSQPSVGTATQAVKVGQQAGTQAFKVGQQAGTQAVKVGEQTATQVDKVGQQTEDQAEPEEAARGGSINDYLFNSTSDNERVVPPVFDASPSSRDRSGTEYVTPYGSIQRSVAGSFHSMISVDNPVV